MKTAALVAVASIASASYLKVDNHSEDQLMDVFNGWIAEFNKTYTPEEKAYRFPIFVKTLRDIENSSVENPNMQFGLNDFADLTDEEAWKHMGLKEDGPEIIRQERVPVEALESPVGHAEGREDNRGRCGFWKDTIYTPPFCVDWTQYKNKVNCGGPIRTTTDACQASGAISAADLVSGHFCAASEKFESFSAQMIMDCFPSAGGCKDYIDDDKLEVLVRDIAALGVCAESEYPWAGKVQTCSKSKRCSYGKMGGASWPKQILYPSNNTLKEQLMKGPIMMGAAVKGFNKIWRNYKGGVATYNDCWKNAEGNRAPKEDHNVLVVGYMGSEGVLYDATFTIKNNWGTSWGEKGYMRVEASGCALNGNGASLELWDSPKSIREGYRAKDTLTEKASFEAAERM